MSDAADRLARLRRIDSQLKSARLLAALDAMVIAGEPLQVAQVARRAGVSRRFVYDHPELRAEIEWRAAETATRFATTIANEARVTGASLRADLENAKAPSRRLRDQIARLERRLGDTIGDEVLAEMAGRGVLITDETLRAKIELLEHDLRKSDRSITGPSDQ